MVVVLLSTRRPVRTCRYAFAELDAKVMEEIKKLRSLKKKVGKSFIVSRFRGLLRKEKGDMFATMFKGDSSWLNRFSRRNGIVLKKVVNNHNMTIEVKIYVMQRHFSWLLRLVRQFERMGPEVVPRPIDWVNVDSVPLPFITGRQETYTLAGDVRPCVATGRGDADHKRAFTAHIVLRCAIAPAPKK